MTPTLHTYLMFPVEALYLNNLDLTDEDML